MPPEQDAGSGGGGGGMPNFGGADQFRGFGGMPGGGGGTRTFHFSTNGGGGGGPGGNFAFSDPESIFADFFRSQSGGGGMGDDDIPGLGGAFRGFQSGMGGSPRTGRRTSSSRFDAMNGAARQPTPEVTVVEKPLPVSLEDVFKGTTKNMRIKRKKFDKATGKQMVEDRILEVPIKPGLKAGSKIKFKDVGDQVEGGTQDLHFIVEEVSYQLPTRFQENYIY
jgi:DnaJ family protein B protein 4